MPFCCYFREIKLQVVLSGRNFSSTNWTTTFTNGAVSNLGWPGMGTPEALPPDLLLRAKSEIVRLQNSIQFWMPFFGELLVSNSKWRMTGPVEPSSKRLFIDLYCVGFVLLMHKK
jgi:hypothetical protein